MARNKRNVASRSTATAAAAVGAKSADLETISHASVKIECERAVTSFRKGNHSRAIKLMDELCSKYKNSSHVAFMNRVRAGLLLDLASVVSEPKAKRGYYKNATETAKRAVSLSPRSIEFAHFYADLLFLLANKGFEYDEVVQVCEKALAVENPVDPLNESLDQWKNQKFSTAESRVAHVQTELRSLIQKSNIASISTWLTNLGNAEVKFKSIPLSRIVGDDTVNDSADMRLFGESKTAEYGRKGTEANMVSNWLVQQMSESSYSGNKVNSHNDSSKELKERKTSNSDEMDRVRPYWNSMSSDRKKDLLRVMIADLQEHLARAFKDGSANVLLREAISFSKENNSWAFWMCCHCSCKFSDKVSFTQHVVKEHALDLPLKVKSLLPESVEDEWVKTNLNCSWKPLDLNAVMKILEKQSEPEVPEFHDKSSPGKHKLGESELMDFDGDCGIRDSLLSDDSERATLLGSILVLFQGLYEQKYLAKSHIRWIINYATKSLQGLACGSQLDLSSISDQTSLFIRALGTPELKKMLKFLQDIFFHSIRLGQYSDPNSEVQDAYTTMEKIVLSDDASYLVLADHFLPCSSPLSSWNEAGATLDSDALLSWIFTASSSAKELASWTRERENGMQKGLKIVQLLQKEFSQVRDSCKRKHEHMMYLKVLKDLEGLCLQVVTKGKKSYKTILTTRLEELIKNSKGTTVSSSELDAITDVLKDAKSLNDQKVYFDETYNKFISEVHNWRTRDSPHKGNLCIALSVRRKKLEVYTELYRMDARLVQMTAESVELSNRLDAASYHDFRSILIPLVKSFLQAGLEDQAKKEAEKESDASNEALVIKFTLDSKKGVGSEIDNSKHAHHMRKDKKKKKKKRNGRKKNPKIVNIDIPHDQTAEEILLPISDDLEIPGSEIYISYSVDDDADPVTNGETKPSDVQVTLQYHGQIEDKAKLDHLSEQHNATKNDGVDNILEVSTTANASMLSMDSVTPQDSGSFSDRHSVSSRKQQTDPNKLSDGINQTLTSEKKDNDAGLPQNSPVFGDLYGAGLRNKAGENNCFLNVIIQSLRHLRRFRDAFLRKKLEHNHVGNPCVVCALYEIFDALSTASAHNTREAVDPAHLRVALSKLYPEESGKFKKGEKHDASETLWEILACFHLSFSPSPVEQTNRDCTKDCCCIAHSIFGMDIVQKLNCLDCGLESRFLQYTSFYHTSNAASLRMMKAKFPEKSFGELLDLVERDQQFICDPETFGCGKPNYKELTLSTAPQVFITFLGLQSHESVEDLAATLTALSTDINISCLYSVLAPHNRHRLISMVCYNAQHYICFCYSHYHEKWIMYNDATVEVIDCWNGVVKTCARRVMWPQILLFESVN